MRRNEARSRRICGRLKTVNRLVIFSVFVVASCGLAYRLIAGALANYLLGDSILQFSSIIGAYLCAMGVARTFQDT
jgi:spermidine synthase